MEASHQLSCAITFDFDAMSSWIGSAKSNNPSMISRGQFGAVAIPRILDLLDRYPRRKLILSPIGAQGFVLGRGNLQLSPEVIKRIGQESIIVVATPAKLARTQALRFDTGDATLDAELRGSGYIPVVIGYRLRRLVRAAD